MKERIENKKVEGVRVSVEMVEAVKPSIHVYNTSKPDEFLKAYFSNEVLSGGGEIEDMKRLNDTAVIITFVDPAGLSI